MGSLLFFAFSWWGILVRIVAIVTLIRRRPDTYWLWIILITDGSGGVHRGGGAAGRWPAPAIFQSIPRPSAYANWKPPFWTIPQPEIMKNGPTCIRKKRNLRGASVL